MFREHTKTVTIGNKKIGGGNPVLIQSMTNTHTEDVEATVRQILELEAAGCEIIRCTVPTMKRQKRFQKSKNTFIFHWLRIFILITAWRLRQWKTVRIKSVSIRAISAVPIRLKL